MKLPKDYKITNFPNPFNPVTKIYYTVPTAGKIKITVYNSLGQNIKDLVNSYKDQGVYIVEFDGSNFPSGIYYYTLLTENIRQTKKMVLVK